MPVAFDPKTVTFTIDGEPPSAECVGSAVLGLAPGEYRLSVQAEGVAIYPDPSIAVLREVEWLPVTEGGGHGDPAYATKRCPVCKRRPPGSVLRRPTASDAPPFVNYLGAEWVEDTDECGHTHDCKLDASLK